MERVGDSRGDDAALDAVLSTAELKQRPSRSADHAAENGALVALAQSMASSPAGILQQLAQTALDLCRAHSAGISLLSDDRTNFYWPALEGQWAKYLGGGTPRAFGPCGTVLDRDAPQLFTHPERHFGYLASAEPGIEEALLIPFHVDGAAVGTVWVICHDTSRAFDAEDVRVLTNLAQFAAVAYQTLQALRDTQKANRLNEEFLATVSHELRTPLNAILGWSHLLRSGTLEADMRQQANDAIERNALSQAQLVNDLLDVSQIVAGKLSMKADCVDLRAVIMASADTIRPSAAAKFVRFQVSIEPDIPLLLSGDADRLAQVVWNLLVNAVKFTPAQGRVDLTLRRTDDTAEIVVSDTGQGIPAEFLPHVFERFRQADGTSTRRHGGLGLGLALVRQLTLAHLGTVTVDSGGSGRGATFIVRLPIRPVSQRMDGKATKGTDREADTLAETRVLVVDDEPDARELVRVVLARRGATVTVVGSAGEALHELTTGSFTLVVADIGMPDQDGYWLMKTIRALPDRHGQVRVIALTAYATGAARARALEAGFDLHLPKPVDPDQLVAAVERFQKQSLTDRAGPP